MGFWDSSGVDFNNMTMGGAYEAGQYGGNGSWASDHDINPEGAAYDPFAYTKGSLLTPWEGKFDGSQYGTGGSGVAAFKPFGYADFNYAAARPDGFDERYNDPGNFTYADYSGQGTFQGPTQAEAANDAGYQFTQQQGQKALEASKAAQGVLKTGGTLKGLINYGQQAASTQYDKVYGRKRSEYDLTENQNRFTYGTNRSNAAENFDRNIRNQQTGYSMRQGAWKDNAAVALEGSRHGYDVATGAYDRNYSKARQGYDDERQHANSVAAAGRANANRAYDRAMNEYTMGRDEFWTNQDRQYAIMDREANRGWEAAYAYGNAQAGLDTDRGNAQASGRVGSANAWTNAAGTIGQNVSDAALYYGRRRPQRPAPAQG
jgi:hypothetical protein